MVLIFKSVISFSKILNFQYHLWSLKLSAAFSLKVVLDTTAETQIRKYSVIYDEVGRPWPDAHPATLLPPLNQAGGKKITGKNPWVKTKRDYLLIIIMAKQAQLGAHLLINLLPGKIELDGDKQKTKLKQHLCHPSPIFTFSPSLLIP